jgi:large repetitive protein
VATTTTDATGTYQVASLLSGPGYAIQFRNPDNNVVYEVIHNVVLGNNITVVDQNLPIDPSGVVYDSVTRGPVAGAIMTLVGSNGIALPTSCLIDPSQQSQRTGSTGEYRFDVVPGGAAQCPVGETTYTIAVAPPANYSAPSTVLIPQASTFDPTGLTGPVRIAPTANPPASGEEARYYYSFRLASGDPDVLFNHIPLDPFLTRTPLIVTKTSIKRTASIGDLVPYTVAVRNTESVQRAGVAVVDILPPGFKYVPGSATLNGVLAEPMVNDRELLWPTQIVPANGTNIYKLTTVVGAGVTGGDRINNGLARNGNAGPEISNRGQAVISIVASTIFDCAEIIGKVYDDLNGNGYQDQGEPGIANARLATVNGQLVTTDEFGRYHITCAAVPDARIGSNFVLKVDTRSLAAGYVPTTDNPQSVRLTRGKVSELNFGVKQAATSELNLDAAGFVDGTDEPTPGLSEQLAALAVATPPSRLISLNYRADPTESTALIETRMAKVRSMLSALLAKGARGENPEFETNLIVEKNQRP